MNPPEGLKGISLAILIMSSDKNLKWTERAMNLRDYEAASVYCKSLSALLDELVERVRAERYRIPSNDIG